MTLTDYSREATDYGLLGSSFKTATNGNNHANAHKARGWL